ncbi:MAG: cbb3-type cytochrome c oxidase subunit I [Anaerolineae bacterium]|nr:cbb3-type cytochrome c oxidase subunit I [Anaerolineae bacterium]
MPLLSRTFIKTGLAYFVVGLMVGVLYLGRDTFRLPSQFGLLYPVYIHLLMVGWVMQLILGVVYWMFPKQSKERPRGSETLGWTVFWLLNVGLILRAISEPLVVVKPEWNLGWVLAASAILQLLAAWGFVANTWGRVKER